MTDRIAATFARLKKENRKGLITFTMAFDPDRETSLAVLRALPAAGADILEVGMPFSDPMADGVTIQNAGIRALNAGATLAGVLEIIREFRVENKDTPVVLMGYYNPVYRYGVEKFAHDAASAGVDGVIIVDVPPEEAGEVAPFLAAKNIHLIRLVAPTTGTARFSAVMQGTGGFVYYIAVKGITGTQQADIAALTREVAAARAHTHLPIAVGFGVKTADDARAMATAADAVVVGSALVDVLHKNGADAALDFVREIALKGR